MLYSLKISLHKSSWQVHAGTSVIPVLLTGTPTHHSREMQNWPKIPLQPLGWGEPEMPTELPPRALQRAEHCDLNLKLWLLEDDLQEVQEGLWLSREFTEVIELKDVWWEEGWVGKGMPECCACPCWAPQQCQHYPQHCNSHTNSS